VKAFLTRPLDRLAMRLGTPTVCITGKHGPAADPVFPLALADLDRHAALPLDFQLKPDGRFRFTSLRPSPWPENNSVPGRLIACPGNWSSRPTVILVHGWNGEYSYEYLFPYLGWRLRRAGINTAMMELPYHGRRKPRTPGAITNFISDDLECMTEAVAQSVADLRSLLAWLAKAGSPAVGLWGISLGAWLAGLVASIDALARFVILLTPVPDMARAIRELPFCAPIRHCLPDRSTDLEGWMLNRHPPRTSKVLIVESVHDLFAPAETVEQLWAAWGNPEIWRVPHGHISVLLSLPILERIVHWIPRHVGGIP